MTITLTEKAEFRLRSFLQGSAPASDSPERGIRVSVKDGGCSGYQYGLDIAQQPQEGDLLWQQGKVRVYVDAKSAPLLNGVVIDFVDSLLESGFKFSNPNATDTCGCGQSFQAGECTPAASPCS
jgi:iron-sulfur cluster assembly protein